MCTTVIVDRVSHLSYYILVVSVLFFFFLSEVYLVGVFVSSRKVNVSYIIIAKEGFQVGSCCVDRVGGDVGMHACTHPFEVVRSLGTLFLALVL